MMMRRMVVVTMLTLSVVANAQNIGVLIEKVPEKASDPAIIAAVRQAFVARRWTVEASDATSVTATIDHKDVRSRMRVVLAGESLTYEESSTRNANPSRAPNASYARRREPIKLDSWLENIRHDVSAFLAGIPDGS